MEQSNMELMQRIIDDHHALLRAGNLPRTRHLGQREPNRLRILFGRLLIGLGERVRGTQPAVESYPPRLATR